MSALPPKADIALAIRSQRRPRPAQSERRPPNSRLTCRCSRQAILPSITIRDAMLKSRVVDYPPLGTKESLAPGFSTTYARRHG